MNGNPPAYLRADLLQALRRSALNAFGLANEDRAPNCCASCRHSAMPSASEVSEVVWQPEAVQAHVTFWPVNMAFGAG